MKFDREGFIDACRSAMTESDPVIAVHEVVERHVAEGPSIDGAFADGRPGPLTLYTSPELTVQRLEWLPGFHSAPHDHRMWAVVGVYGGAEHNWFHRRGPRGLEGDGGRVIEQGEVLTLGAEAIHSVANPSRSPVVGLHVYGGDIDGVPRSQCGLMSAKADWRKCAPSTERYGLRFASTPVSGRCQTATCSMRSPL